MKYFYGYLSVVLIAAGLFGLYPKISVGALLMSSLTFLFAWRDEKKKCDKIYNIAQNMIEQQKKQSKNTGL